MKLPGYAAITTVMFMSVVLLVVSTTIAFTSLNQRTGNIVLTNKAATNEAAEACMEEARLKIILNNTYTGNETITLSSGSLSTACVIGSITRQANYYHVPYEASIPSLAGAPTTYRSIIFDSTTFLPLTVRELVTPE